MNDSHEIIMGLGIDELELSVRSYNCLKRAGINTVLVGRDNENYTGR